MNANNSEPENMGREEHVSLSSPKVSLWQKLGGGSLSIAVVLHVALLLVGAVWIFQIIKQPEKVNIMPPGGGGGKHSAQSQLQQKRQAQISPSSDIKRVVSSGSSTIEISELGEFSQVSPLKSLSPGGSLSGEGKIFGNGGSLGPDVGLPIGIKDGIGKFEPFGGVEPDKNALVGTFYDLKQTKNRKATDINDVGVRGVIRDFVNHGWKEQSLTKYFKADRTLYQNRIYIPKMDANAAPAAFQCEKDVKPGRWLVVYRGEVSPSKSGRYRFVGAADDVMVVRFNGKHVLDHGFSLGTLGLDFRQMSGVLSGTVKNNDLRRLAKKSFPMEIPVNYYQYPSTGNWNGAIGGLAVGAEFDAEVGRSYPIEILISEIPGGLFCASLLIEEVGVKYEKISNGAPILPLFRLDSGVPEVDPKSDNAPPFDGLGPVWGSSGKGGSHLDI